MDELEEIWKRLRDQETRLRLLERVAWILAGATLFHGGVDLMKYLAGK